MNKNIESLRKDLYSKYNISVSKDDPMWMVFEILFEVSSTFDEIENLHKKEKNNAEIIEKIVNNTLERFDNTTRAIVKTQIDNYEYAENLEKMFEKFSSLERSNEKKIEELDEMLQATVRTFSLSIKDAVKDIDKEKLNCWLEESLQTMLEELNTKPLEKAVSKVTYFAEEAIKKNELVLEEIGRTAEKVEEYNKKIDGSVKNLEAIKKIKALYLVAIIAISLTVGFFISYGLTSLRETQHIDDIKNLVEIKYIKEGKYFSVKTSAIDENRKPIKTSRNTLIPIY